ncbi:MAG: PHP domain-containing protein [Lachnospiraceae bacterium]|nr:PHP domain-containing protein [Lachnospiraceae bacterium]
MYKIEPHLHTAYISKCAWMGAAPIVRWYCEAGYDAICVTDHYNRTCFDYSHIDIHGEGDKVKQFLEGYYRVKEEAQSCGLKVYEGAELRFDGSENDYLLYGFHHELLADPEQLMSEGLAAFAPKYRADGAVLIQAHPFREGCTPAPAEYLDGVEVINNNPRHVHHANNDKALEFAKKHNLLMTAGSDFHEPGEAATTGILSETLPEDSFAFARLLKSGNYTLI